MRESGWRPWAIVLALLLIAILAPFLLLEQRIHTWAERLTSPHLSTEAIAAAVISLLALDIFLPVPSSIVSTAAGAALGLLPGLAASLAGMTLGSLLGYGCGRRYGLPLVRRVVRDRDLEHVLIRFRRSAGWALAAMRPVPVLAEASALVAGVAGVPLPAYIGITTLANTGISLVYCAIGASVLQSGSFLLAFAASLLLPGLAMLIGRVLRYR